MNDFDKNTSTDGAPKLYVQSTKNIPSLSKIFPFLLITSLIIAGSCEAIMYSKGDIGTLEQIGYTLAIFVVLTILLTYIAWRVIKSDHSLLSIIIVILTGTLLFLVMENYSPSILTQRNNIAHTIPNGDQPTSWEFSYDVVNTGSAVATIPDQHSFDLSNICLPNKPDLCIPVTVADIITKPSVASSASFTVVSSDGGSWSGSVLLSQESPTFDVGKLDLTGGDFSGSFTLQELMVHDALGNIMYVAPKAESTWAQLVEDPLPIRVSANELTTPPLSIGVVGVDSDESPGDYGYDLPTFTPVSTFAMPIAIVDIGASAGRGDGKIHTELTSATLTVISDGRELIKQELGAGINLIDVPDDHRMYQLIITKPGHEVFSRSVYIDELSDRTVNNPFVIPIALPENPN